MFRGLAGLFIRELIERGEIESLEEMGAAVRDALWIEILEKQMLGALPKE